MGSSVIRDLPAPILKQYLHHTLKFSACVPKIKNAASGKLPVNRYGKTVVGRKVRMIEITKLTKAYTVNAVTLIER